MKCTCVLAGEAEGDIRDHAEDCERRRAFDPERTDAFVLTHQRFLCGVHMLPFRDRWPLGFAVFVVEVVSAVDGIWEEARQIAKVGADVDLGLKALEPVLDRRPACCRVSHKALVTLYETTKIGLKKVCKVCGAKRMGTAIETAEQGRIRHVCFPCIAASSAKPMLH